jgi:hypothetical protein
VVKPTKSGSIPLARTGRWTLTHPVIAVGSGFTACPNSCKSERNPSQAGGSCTAWSDSSSRFPAKLFLEGGDVDEANTSDFEIAPKVRERFAGNYRHLVSG